MVGGNRDGDGDDDAYSDELSSSRATT